MGIESQERRFYSTALNYSQFKWLWISHIASVTSRRMCLAIFLWHISILSDQPIALGITGIVQLLAILVVALIAGVISDSINRLYLLYFSQFSFIAIILLLGGFTSLHIISTWSILVFIFLNASAYAIETPPKFSLVPNLVPEEKLTNAFSLFTIAYHFGNILGPLLAGVVISNWGIGKSYLFTGLINIIAILALRKIRLINQRQEMNYRQLISVNSIVEGIQFVRNHPLIFPSMLIDFWGTLLCSITILIPIYINDVLQANAIGYGWLFAAISIGGGIMSLFLLFLKKLPNQGLLLFSSIVVYGIANVLFGISRSYSFAFISLILIGIADALSTIIRQTIRQIHTPDYLRGRMTSVNQIFFQGGPFLGDFRAGFVAQFLGASWTAITGGISCLFAISLIILRYPKLRMYKGIP
jgi:MFS family permease